LRFDELVANFSQFLNIILHCVSDSCEDLSNVAQKLVAAVVISVVVFVNCASVRLSTRFLTVFSFGKILSLTIIIIGGIVMLAQGKTPN